MIDLRRTGTALVLAGGASVAVLHGPSPGDAVVPGNDGRTGSAVGRGHEGDVAAAPRAASGTSVGSPFAVLESRVEERSRSGAAPDAAGTDGADGSVAKRGARDVTAAGPPAADESTLSRLLAAPLSGEGETVLLERLRVWSDREPDEAARWIERALSGAEAGSMASALAQPLLYRWLELEPEIVMSRLDTLATPDERPYLIRAHASRLVDERSAEDALAWAESLADDGSRDAAVDEVLRRWTASDPKELAERMMSGAPDGGDGVPTTVDDTLAGEAGSALADALVERNPSLALRWAERLPEGAAAPLEARAVGAWLARDPSAAGDWLDGVVARTGTLPEATAAALATHDLELAVRTLPSLSGRGRAAAVTGVATVLARRSTDAARSWIATLPDVASRERATHVTIRESARDEPRAALDGALDTRRATRLTLLVETAETVAGTEPDVLLEWLASAPLDPRERDRLAMLVNERVPSPRLR